MTRKYMAINVEVWAQSKYSAIFVAVSSLGMTLGPGLSSVLEFIPNTTVIGITIVTHNIFSLFLFFIWIVIAIIFFILFIGHDVKKGSDEKLKQIEYEEYVYDQRILTGLDK